MFPTLKGYSLFIVFDGHSGAQYANTVSKEFPNFLLCQEPFKSMATTDLKCDVEEIKNGIRKAFLEYDAKMSSIKEIQTSGW